MSSSDLLLPTTSGSNSCRTTMVSCSQTWSIDNFNQYSTDAYCGQYPKILSTRFTTPDNYQNLQFYLDLRPRGDSDSNSDFVSLFLSSEGKGERTIMCAMSVLDAKGEKRSTKSSLRKDVAENADYGYYRFISHKELKDPKNNLLPNDRLTVFVEVNVLVAESSSDDSNLKSLIDRESTGTTEMWTGIQENSKFADVKLCFSNRKSTTAHKVVLAARSPVFAAMFENDMKEKNENQVDIKEVSFDTFKILLRYMYTGKVVDPEKLGAEVYQAADMYQLDNLKAICEESLCLQVQAKPKLASTLLGIANLHDATKLRAKALEMIKKQNVQRMNEVLNNPDQLLEIDDILTDLTKKSKPNKKKKSRRQ